MRCRALACVIPAALLVAAIASRVVIAHAPHTVAEDLAQPIPVVTNWGSYGALLFGVLFASLAIAMVAYVAVLRYALRLRLRRAQGDNGSSGASSDNRSSASSDGAFLSVGFVVAVCAISLVCAGAIPAMFSSDLYAYAAYGELVRLGQDPYAHALLARGDAIFDAAVWQWGNPPPTCVYGPLFVWIASAILMGLHGLGALAQLVGLRLLAAGSLLACIPLAYRAYPGSHAQRVAAAATIGLNPVAIWCAAEGHNDALALAIVLGGYALVRSGRVGVGAAVATFAGAIKLPGILAAFPLLRANRRAQAGILVACVLTVVLSIPMLQGVMLRVAPHGRYAPQASLEAILKPLSFPIASNDVRASVLTWIVAALVALPCVLAAIRSLRKGELEGWAYLAAGGWLLVPNPYPWYALWLLPLAALVPSTDVATTLIWLSLASVLRYVPDAVGAPNGAGSVVLGIAASLPFLALLRRRAVPWRKAGIMNGSLC